ncbi:MAG TPA: DUF3108 domain-containing protein [Ideonella sp.]|nr:DUF3108 domain-containing protein [Ideonella sp.]
MEPSAEAPAPPAAAPATVPPETPPVTPAPQPAPAAGTPPPVYPTEPPLNRTLDYRVVRGPASGLGQLRWEATPSAYTLSLQASVAGGPVLDWTSTGGFDSAGLAPQRMVERQREREVHAVNFQRDKQLISFSGPSRVEPLLRGAQDRLSWLIQLAAVVQAQRATLKEGDTLRFQVASPRGDVDEWVFTLMGIAPLEVAGMRWGALKLVREPQRPYDQRVEVWLAPVASYLPLALTLTTVPGGVPLELWLTGGLRIDL